MFSANVYMKAYTLLKHTFYISQKSHPSSFNNPNGLQNSTFDLHAVKEYGGVEV
jgi:hypothetical protein